MGKGQDQMIQAVIDVGSNSIRMSVYQCDCGSISPMIDKKETVGLAGYIEDGILTEEGMYRAADTIGDFIEVLHKFGIENISVFATASLRNAVNQEEAVRFIEERTGFKVAVISGDEEARLDFIGATQFLSVKNGVLVDIGGGSTEVVLFSDGRISNLTSIPMGSLNMYTKYASGVTLDNEERKLMRQGILDNLDTLYWAPMEPVGTLVGVGGTARAFKKICHELYKVPRDIQRLDAGYLNMLVKIFKKGDVNLCRKIYKMVPERMLTIQPGLTILNELAKQFGITEVVVSRYGVREGYLIEHVLKNGGDH